MDEGLEMHSLDDVHPIADSTHDSSISFQEMMDEQDKAERAIREHFEDPELGKFKHRLDPIGKEPQVSLMRKDAKYYGIYSQYDKMPKTLRNFLGKIKSVDTLMSVDTSKALHEMEKVGAERRSERDEMIERGVPIERYDIFTQTINEDSVSALHHSIETLKEYNRQLLSNNDEKIERLKQTEHEFRRLQYQSMKEKESFQEEIKTLESEINKEKDKENVDKQKILSLQQKIANQEELHAQHIIEHDQIISDLEIKMKETQLARESDKNKFTKQQEEEYERFHQETEELRERLRSKEEHYKADMDLMTETLNEERKTGSGRVIELEKLIRREREEYQEFKQQYQKELNELNERHHEEQLAHQEDIHRLNTVLGEREDPTERLRAEIAVLHKQRDQDRIRAENAAKNKDNNFYRILETRDVRLETAIREMKQEQERTTERVTQEVESVNERIELLQNQNERVQERMTLRERIKAIFKKYGFTVIAVVTAVSVVIGTIVHSLSRGLNSVGKGVGNALKGLGKKIGEILPGMVGAIASFIFRTAGQVITFLGKNAWLLIMAVVLFFIEQLKNKRS